MQLVFALEIKAIWGLMKTHLHSKPFFMLTGIIIAVTFLVTGVVAFTYLKNG